MFYSNNDNYMQDLYFYNQTPNNTYFPNNMPNYNIPLTQNQNMINPMYNNSNMNANQMCQNINNLYPNIYRIINPVVLKVIANSNYQFLNDDVLNNMTDTVYNIVEGQIDYDDNISTTTENSQSTSSNTNSVSSNSNSRVTETRQSNTSQTSNSKSNRNDNLLKDIIKILILKEILSRPNRNNPNYYPYYNQMPYNPNY